MMCLLLSVWVFCVFDDGCSGLGDGYLVFGSFMFCGLVGACCILCCVLNCVCYMYDVGCWVLCCGCWMLGVWMLGVGC